ncbi:MAG: TrmH family RNA methyltransferase [Candidatus Peribacteraceae bacterium]|nr:TrmH family RNA methyltransferase [Candidatus Peribacteraceae bacterium]
MDDRRIRLLAHNVRSLWNVGSFFRTCDAFAVENIHLTGYTGCPPRKEITKTAIGADENVPWESAREPLPVLRRLKEEGWKLLALELAPRAKALKDIRAGGKICLIVGHELEGIPSDILALCDEIAMIPMQGKKESLNVAVAAGIALHHLRCVAGT